MKEPARTLIGEIERVVSALPDTVLFQGLGADGLQRFQAIMGMAPPPGLAACRAPDRQWWRRDRPAPVACRRVVLS